MNAPKLRVAEVDLRERDVAMRLPFRYGVVTLTEAQQAALRQEMRKVKLEEIESIKARQKRVEMNKKQQIIEKEKAQESFVKTMKNNEA